MILITGATGHIGNVLVRSLADRYPSELIRILILPGEKLDMFDGLTLDLYYGDIRRRVDVRRAVRGARLVFHLAGLIDIAPRRPNLLQEVNITGTRNIVEACQDFQVGRLIFVSSVHALPDLPDNQLITEAHDFPVPGLLGPYAHSKSAATALVFEAAENGLDAVVLFPAGVIGPHDYQQSQMGRMIRYLSTQGWLRVVVSFDGAYNFIDVRDVAAGILAAAENGKAGEGYILSGHLISMRDLISLVRQSLAQRHPRIIFIPVWMVKSAAWLTGGLCRLLRIKPLFTPYSVYVLFSNSNISRLKAATELGFEVRPLTDTFRDTMNWLAESGLIKRKKKLDDLTQTR